MVYTLLMNTWTLAVMVGALKVVVADYPEEQTRDVAALLTELEAFIAETTATVH